MLSIENRILRDTQKVDIRFEREFDFTVRTRNAEGTRYFAGLVLLSLLVSVGATFFTTLPFRNLRFADLGPMGVTAIAACIVNAILWFWLRIERGPRCIQCQKHLPDGWMSVYCQTCERKYGFAKMEKAATDALKESLTEWYDLRPNAP